MGTPTAIIKSEWFILTLILSLYAAIVIGLQWPVFSTSYSLSEYGYMYRWSQYVVGKGSAMLMGDSDLYTFAGIRYAQGEDPTQLNFEHPPFVKYLFGLSYLLTGKPNWVIIPLFFLGGFSFWSCVQALMKSSWARWLSLLLFLGHSTIFMALPQTMLDFPMTALLLCMLALYLKLLHKPSMLLSLGFGVITGMFLLARYPMPLSILLVGLLLLFLIWRRFSLRFLSVSLLAIILTYLAGYTAFFVNHHTVLDFLKFEWWRLHWYFGKTDQPKGMIWMTIFLGKFPQYWKTDGSYFTVQHWNVLWPVTFILYALSLVTGKTNLKRNPLLPYQLWIILALIVYSFGAAEDRFLIPLIPGFALFGAAFIERLYQRRRRQIA